MFFRFGAGLFLVVLISLLGIAIEKRSLDLRRDLSRQHYRMDVLRDEHARLRLKCQQLAAVDRLFQTVEQDGTELSHPKLPVTAPDSANSDESDDSSEQAERRIPLLFFQRPLADPRLQEADE
ncbi:hypothetical protein GC176_10970 [bacterium]|nr:hypothetical protein [bacterium]